MQGIADLERRVRSLDPSLSPEDFVKAHNEIDALYNEFASSLRERANLFCKKNRLTYVQAAKKYGFGKGKEMAIPVGDR